MEPMQGLVISLHHSQRWRLSSGLFWSGKEASNAGTGWEAYQRVLNSDPAICPNRCRNCCIRHPSRRGAPKPSGVPVRLLGLGCKREGRLIRFPPGDMQSYPDAQIGAAVRDNATAKSKGCKDAPGLEARSF